MNRATLNFELWALNSYIRFVNVPSYVAVAVLAYLLGSIPSGYVVARAKGVDIRAAGSGNIGATNAFRVLGRTAGIGVLVADGSKGWLAVALLPQLVFLLFGIPAQTETREYYQIVSGICVVLGHNYTCWLKFKGGKGIATSAGVLAALVPWSLVIILSLWILIFLATRYVSVASIAASLALPFATWLTGQSILLIIVTAAMGCLAIYKHRGNIQRLLKGTENRFSFSKEKGTHPRTAPS